MGEVGIKLDVLLAGVPRRRIDLEEDDDAYRLHGYFARP